MGLIKDLCAIAETPDIGPDPLIGEEMSTK